ncbi:MAG: nucleotidyltransferase family protein [Ignavibacteriales bacterium]|nr:nucleotidyltransferase family protein [Ignavibacteriales bacterium]
MKAMILAAGLGTRLRPITDKIPKALVTIKNKTLLEITIEKLKKTGIREIVINVHHFPDLIINYIKQNKYFNIRIEISNERNNLLDTGGGIKKAEWFLRNDDFIVHNIDIISDIDIIQMYEFHKSQNALATVAVKNRETQRYFLFDDEMNLCGWKNIKTNEIKIVKGTETKLIPLAYSGIQILSPKIFDLMTESGKFSIVDTYIRLAQSCTIKAFRHDDFQWYDVGKIDVLNYLNRNWNL